MDMLESDDELIHRANYFYLMPDHSHDTQDQVWKVLKTGMY
jgi:hypothetical protein